MTRVAMAVCDGRVAPVFDVSRRLLVVDVENGKELLRAEHAIEETIESRRVSHLRDLGVDVLICGAITRRLAEAIERTGIRVIPWVGGFIEEVFSAYLAGQLPDPRFTMPGCGRGGRRYPRRRRCGQRGIHW